MLRIENIHFSYSEREILRGITLSLKKGVNCVLGPNGSGKSTLLKIAAGILTPQQGSVELDGKNVTNMNPRNRSKLISYVPQEFSVSFPYTAMEVVLMGRNPYLNPFSGPSHEDEKLAKSYMKALNTENIFDKPFTHLSGGQKRIILIARGLVQQGEFMVFDEPTASLDFKNQLLVLAVIENIAKQLGKYVLLSLHDPNLALLFCDEIFLLKDGNIIKGGRPERAITEESMMELYSIKTHLLEAQERTFIVPNKEFLQTLLGGKI